MADDDKPKPTQPSQPKKGEPVEIPVPSRKEVEDFFKRVTRKQPAPEGDSKRN